MIACYIIYSPSFNKYYVGVTQEDIEIRLSSHNSKKYGMHKATSFSNDWEIFYWIECFSLAQAMKIEKHIKSMNSLKYYHNLKYFPEISEKLLKNYS